MICVDIAKGKINGRYSLMIFACGNTATLLGQFPGPDTSFSHTHDAIER
ncbi:hypothetical protein ECMP0209401_3556 [Escherichia coli MP020940.1]|nr:hypothetical protein ECMP0209401_3556 [Escherichia coli MP020940.1]